MSSCGPNWTRLRGELRSPLHVSFWNPGCWSSCCLEPSLSMAGHRSTGRLRINRDRPQDLSSKLAQDHSSPHFKGQQQGLCASSSASGRRSTLCFRCDCRNCKVTWKGVWVCNSSQGVSKESEQQRHYHLSSGQDTSVLTSAAG